MFGDSHVHWSDKRFSDYEIVRLIRLCGEQRISYFLMAGVEPADWQRQLDLKHKYPDLLRTCFGLHPYFVALNSRDTCEEALDQLAQLIPQASALGETGLDFRKEYLPQAEVSEAQQIDFFENQIQLANVFDKPLVLHIVRAHEKAQQILGLWKNKNISGFVHAFSGSFEVARAYLDLNLKISVGGAVTFSKNKKLHEAIKKIDLENLLLETDSPDQPPEKWIGLNNSTSLWQVAQTVGEIKNLAAEEVLEKTTSNLKMLLTQ